METGAGTENRSGLLLVLFQYYSFNRIALAEELDLSAMLNNEQNFLMKCCLSAFFFKTVSVEDLRAVFSQMILLSIIF